MRHVCTCATVTSSPAFTVSFGRAEEVPALMRSLRKGELTSAQWPFSTSGHHGSPAEITGCAALPRSLGKRLRLNPNHLRVLYGKASAGTAECMKPETRRMPPCPFIKYAHAPGILFLNN